MANIVWVIMIELHRLNGDRFWLNHNRIEMMEKRPDTVIRMENQNRYVIQETVPEVINKIIEFNRAVVHVGEVGEEQSEEGHS